MLAECNPARFRVAAMDVDKLSNASAVQWSEHAQFCAPTNSMRIWSPTLGSFEYAAWSFEKLFMNAPAVIVLLRSAQ